jgi:two-component system OmpR family response regulator
MKPSHILIVDDEAQIRSLLTEFLTRVGYRVTPVSTAIEAQEAVRADPPDLIITDLQLEDSDGLDMIGRLRAALPSTPVILLTGVLFDPKVARDVLSKKVSCYLPKTSSLSRILSEVQRLLGPGS